MTARWRLVLVMGTLALLFCALGARLVWLQVVQGDFLVAQGEMRSARAVTTPAHRGMIVDRNGTPLAVSTPVTSIWADPRQLPVERLGELAVAAGVSEETLRQRHRVHRAFFYVSRQLPPAQANDILSLDIPGVYGQPEYKRYYPAGEVTAHVLGFTNIDDQGQEGIELAYDERLRGTPGRDLVLQTVHGDLVRHVETLEAPQPGENLELTIDLDLQFEVYQALKEAYHRHQADWASAVVMDPSTGDILALANLPGFNPNDRLSIRPRNTRNRALTDAIEPGSVMKTMAIAGALEQGLVTPDTEFNTNPGRLRLADGSVIEDYRNYGLLDTRGVMVKSSNVGASQIALDMGGENLWSTYYRFGLGQSIGIGFPGEATGSLPNRTRWAPSQLATMSYGYGLTATPMHIAQAYAAIANDGVMVSPRLLRRALQTDPQRVVSSETAAQVRAMLAGVMSDEGTGRLARVPSYSAAGKTGTTHTIGLQGYEEDNYRGVFVGYAPADDPELVVAVVIDNPRGESYFGGAVAGPVFSKIVQSALPHRGQLPDRLQAVEARND